MLYHIIVICYRLTDVEQLSGELRVQFRVECPETASVIHSGSSSTLKHGFLVVEWLAAGDELDDSLLYLLERDDRVADVCPFPVPIGSNLEQFRVIACKRAATVPAAAAPAEH